MSATETISDTTTESRIRLVTGIVSVDKDGDLLSVPVSLRFDWQGAMPDHSCTTINCATCREQAFRKAVKRSGGGRALAFHVRRDGQSQRTPR